MQVVEVSADLRRTWIVLIRRWFRDRHAAVAQCGGFRQFQPMQLHHLAPDYFGRGPGNVQNVERQIERVTKIVIEPRKESTPAARPSAA